jgi:hypothetical protein
VKADGVANWSQVVAVRISLLVVGQDLNTTTGTQSYVLRDTNNDGTLDRENAPDTRLRQVFTSTIALRNRVL